MKLLSKLFGRFFKKKTASQRILSAGVAETKEKHPGMIRTCTYLSYGIIHPCDMMEKLGITIARETLTDIALNLNEITLFDMFNFAGDFIGSFYAFKYNDLYFGNIVGSNEIIACETDAFKFVQTDMLKIPFKIQEQNLYALLCKYNVKTGSMFPVLWGRFDNGTLNKELHAFPQNTSMNDAITFCRKESKKF